MMAGPQYYPGASRAYWHEDSYPGSAMEVNVAVLHSTEGTSLPSYGGGASAPNITAVPDFGSRKLRWFQHFRIDSSSRALVNLRGGAETNTLNVVQVELVGTCDPSTHRRWGSRRHIYWPEAPDWALRDLGEFLGWLHREHDLKLRAPSQWPAYPGSYGRTSARMSTAEWQGFYGVCGHMHVVENDHGDPGSIDIDKVLAYARGEEEDMAVSDDDAKKIAQAVADLDDYEVPWESGNTHNQFKHSVASRWRQSWETVNAVQRIEEKVDRIAVGGVDLDVLAAKVADLLAARLES